MGSLGAVLKNPDDFYPLLKLKMAARHAEKQIPPEPHWAFCYTMLHKVSRSFALVIQQLTPELRNAVSPPTPFPQFTSDVSRFLLIILIESGFDPSFFFFCRSRCACLNFGVGIAICGAMFLPRKLMNIIGNFE